MESSLIMLLVLTFVLITLASATSNNVSSKPIDNNVSSSLYFVWVKVKRKNKKEKNENSTNDIIVDKRSCWSSFQLNWRGLKSRRFLSLFYGLNLHRTYFYNSFFWHGSHFVTEDNREQMASPVCMACRVPLGHLAVMDVTEPKETRAAGERLVLRDHLV